MNQRFCSELIFANCKLISLTAFYCGGGELEAFPQSISRVRNVLGPIIIEIDFDLKTSEKMYNCKVYKFCFRGFALKLIFAPRKLMAKYIFLQVLNKIA